MRRSGRGRDLLRLQEYALIHLLDSSSVLQARRIACTHSVGRVRRALFLFIF